MGKRAWCAERIYSSYFVLIVDVETVAFREAVWHVVGMESDRGLSPLLG